MEILRPQILDIASEVLVGSVEILDLQSCWLPNSTYTADLLLTTYANVVMQTPPSKGKPPYPLTTNYPQ